MRTWKAFAIVSLLAGCAYGPKVTKVERQSALNSSNDSGVVIYSLPRSHAVVDISFTYSTFVPGPLTADLEHWMETQKEQSQGCALSNLNDPKDACFWRFRSKRPRAADSLAWCRTYWPAAHKGGDEDAYATAKRERMQNTVFVVSEPKLSVNAVPDNSKIYSIELSPRAWEKLTLGLKFSSLGTITSFSAKGENPLGEIAISSASAVLKTSLMDLPPTAQVAEERGKTALAPIVAELAKLRSKRLKLVLSPEVSPAALSALDAEEARLRELVEGRVATVEAPTRLVKDIGDKMGGQAFSIGSFAAPSCSENPQKVDVKLKLAARESPETELLSEVAQLEPKGAGLRYRAPVTATGMLELGCPGDPVKCADGKELSGAIPVPQWSPVRALPRRLGWGSGALMATIDGNTGALMSVDASADSAPAAELVKQMLAKPAAVDGEMGGLRREQERLDLIQKICASRAVLNLPSGPECTSK